MHKSRLIEVFKTLDKKDLREINKMVQSPYFNQREDVIKLFDYLNQHTPFKKAYKIERANVYPHIYGDKKYDEKKIGYAMSFLYNVIKEYLCLQEFSSDQVNKSVFLSRAFKKRSLIRQFEKTISEADQMLHDQPFRNNEYHFNKYQILIENYENSMSQSRSTTVGFKELAEELNVYFIANKLVQYCSTLSNSNILQNHQEHEMLEEVFRIINHKKYFDIPAIALYYYSYKALTEPTEQEYFRELRRLLKKHSNVFPVDELLNFYILAVNYCIRQYNGGNLEYNLQLFEIYKEGLDLKIFLIRGIISRWTYTNIVKAGLGLKEYDWVENFINEYKDKLDIKYKENAYIWNLSVLYYRQQDYNKAMDLLQQTDFDDVLINLEARSMLLKIYYELDEIDALNSLLDSFKNFIYRHKDLGYHRDNYLNLIKIVRKLLKANTYDKSEMIKIKDDISETKALAERSWLLDQLGKI